MFRLDKWTAWYEAQPQHIKHWMDADQPIWYDRDMWRAGFAGVLLGILIGLCF